MTAPTGAGARAGRLSDLLDDVEQEIRAAEATVGAIGRGVGAVLDQLPGDLVDGVRRSAADLQRLFAEQAATLRELLARAGDDVALLAAGSSWSDRIGGVARGLAAQVAPDSVRAADHWTGTAADAYRGTLPAQQAALAAIGATAEEVDATLTGLADALLAFWSAILRSLIVLDLGLATAAAGTATGVGTAAGLTHAVATVLVFDAEVTAASGSLTGAVTEAESRGRELDRRLSAGTAFPGGAWPRSTTSLPRTR